jgi:hypothetical protein
LPTVSTVTKNFSAAKAGVAAPITKKVATIHFFISAFTSTVWKAPALHGYGLYAEEGPGGAAEIPYGS